MNKQLFKPKVIYFGLCNLLGAFQQMINSILWEFSYKGVLENYMDDFVIYTKTKKELEEKTIQFLKMIKKYNLCFKWSKCNFNTEEIPILEVVVEREVQMENNKVKEWQTPTCQS